MVRLGAREISLYTARDLALSLLSSRGDESSLNRAAPAPILPIHTRTAAEGAILRTLAYADVFGFPLELPEVVRYCFAPAGSQDEIEAAVETLVEDGIVGSEGGYFYLAGREGTVFTRRRLAQSSRRGWRVARRWGRVLWMVPYVRMVAVTGSLAVESKDDEEDIDFMVVAEPGRLWLVRAFSLLVWRVAGLAGARLCPNYFLTTDALTLWQRDLYTARELVQMAPLHGREIARRMSASNGWTRDFLPNARLEAAHASDELHPVARAGKRAAEWLLAGSLVSRLEAWECERKISQLRAESLGARESMFSASVCKDHAHSHGRCVRRRYALRLAALVRLLDEDSRPYQERLASWK